MIADHSRPMHDPRPAGRSLTRPLLLLCALSLCLVIGFAYLGKEVREPDMTSADQHLLGRVVAADAHMAARPVENGLALRYRSGHYPRHGGRRRTAGVERALVR